MMLRLPTYRKRDDFTIDELVTVAGDLIRQAALSQSRWKVTEVPDARTVRYYMSTGLLDKPLAYEGSASRFGYRHLLKLLAIKTLQAQYLPLRKIKEVLNSMEEKDLERLVRDGVPGELPARKTNDMNDRRSRTQPALAIHAMQHFPFAHEVRPAKERLLARDAADRTAGSQTWERLEIEPGLELEIRYDFRGTESPSRMNALLSKIRGMLEAHNRRRHEAE